MAPSTRTLRHFTPIAVVIMAILTGFFWRAEAQDQTKGGAIFKIPDGYMTAPLTDFRGQMMVDPKRAAGVFVTYPNDNETTEALGKRLIDFIGPMFIHDEKGKPKAGLTWSAKPLMSHPGNGEGKASLNTYSDATREVRIAIYERTGGVRPFLYGYFALRHKPSVPDDGKFLDDQGKGVKAFDKLWKSFPK